MKNFMQQPSAFVDYEFRLSEFIFVVLKMIHNTQMPCDYTQMPCDYTQMPAGKYQGIEVFVASVKKYNTKFGECKVVTMSHKQHLLVWFTTTTVSVREKTRYIVDLTASDVFSDDYCTTKVSRVKFLTEVRDAEKEEKTETTEDSDQ